MYVQPESVRIAIKLVQEVIYRFIGAGGGGVGGKGMGHFATVPMHFKVKEYPPPHITGLGEERRLDDFRRHPGVRAGGAHPRRVVDLACQAEVRDLERVAAHVLVAHHLPV